MLCLTNFLLHAEGYRMYNTLERTEKNSTSSSSISVLFGSNVVLPNGTIDFGMSSIGSMEVYPLIMINSGSSPLSISNVTISGTGFKLFGSHPSILGVTPSDSGYVWVQVSSNTTGSFTGLITIYSDDPINPSYIIHLKASLITCSAAITITNIYQDYDANYANSTLDYTNDAWQEKARNPNINSTNPSYFVAEYNRPVTGEYDGVRYVLCNTSNFITITDSLAEVRVQVYSPTAGVPVLMKLRTDAEVVNTTSYPATTSVTVYTTKANEWELLRFNHNAAAGVPGLRYIEFFIDPLAAFGNLTYYVDNFQLADTSLKTTATISTLPANAIEVFPNPSISGEANVLFKGLFNNISIAVYNITGNKILSMHLDSVNYTSQTLLLNTVPPGIYFIQINTEQGQMVKKLIKE